MPQTPAVQTVAALSGAGHWLPQVPQLLMSDCTSWQLAVQHVSALLTHGCAVEQPWAQAFDTQMKPALQSVSPRHSTH